MPTAYADIFRAVALRAKQLGDGSSTDIESFYTAPIFRDELEGVEIPRSALKQDILAVEAELAAMVAASNNTIYKRALSAVSSPIPKGAEVPLYNDRGWRFLGAYDGIFDAVDGTPLTEQPKQVVRRRVNNAGGFWKLPAYYFNIDGTIINHTRDNVVFRGCAWDYATQSNLYDTLFSNPIITTFMDEDVDNGSDGIIETQAHGYYTGLRVQVTNINANPDFETELPNGMAEGVDYYVILIDENHYRLAATLPDSLIGTSINITTDPIVAPPLGPGDQGPHQTVPQEVAGGGQSPLSQELAVLWQARVLAQLPQEDWFVQEAGFYAQLADSKANEVIEGRMKLMTLPSMPTGSSRVAMTRD